MTAELRRFYRLDVAQRWEALAAANALAPPQLTALRERAVGLPLAAADRMVENVVGVFGLPLALALNLQVDAQAYLVPLVVEEPSIVAALSSAAKVALAGGGFFTEGGERLLCGQVQLTGVARPQAMLKRLLQQKAALMAQANALVPRLVARGGGCKDLTATPLQVGAHVADCVVVQLWVDTCDAMGANLVNTLCEQLAPTLAQMVDAKVGLRILSNLTERCLVRARVELPVSHLGNSAFSGQAVRDGVVAASAFADADVHRAVTHNKGIMNGVDAVALATGNDWRAIEANAHAYAGRGPGYRPLSQWRVGDDGSLQGSLEMPLKVGVAGGNFAVNPGVAWSQAVLGNVSAARLGRLMAAVGLAQNFAALRALSTAGIQRGHMALHARSVAASAKVPAQHFQAVVDAMLASGEVKLWRAEALLQQLRQADRHGPMDPANHSTPSGTSVPTAQAAVPSASDIPDALAPMDPSALRRQKTLPRQAAASENLAPHGLVPLDEVKQTSPPPTRRLRPQKQVGFGEAAGKVLLLGEHAVVYGARAIAVPLPLATTVEVMAQKAAGVRVEVPAWGVDTELRWDAAASGLHRPLACILAGLHLSGAQLHIKVTARVPRAMGLGSSASLAVATLRALDDLYALGLTNEAINAAAFAAETVAHGKASGVDNTLATYGRPLMFCRDGATNRQPVAIGAPFTLVVGQTAEPSLTAVTVARVAAAHRTRPELYQRIFTEVDLLVGEALTALARGDLATLGVLMNLNHGLLTALEVSTPSLACAVDVARRHGALGAKLTGGGGGGSMVALRANGADALETALERAGFAPLSLSVEAAPAPGEVGV